MTGLDAIRTDLAAFADDDEEVVVEKDGSILFVRNGDTIACRVVRKQDALFVERDGQLVPYTRFLMQLARLDLLAERLLTKRPSIPHFINSPAELDCLSENRQGRAIELLDMECGEESPFSTRVVFLTADAGHGKTALLREYQHRTAKQFIDGKSSFLFWHIDLQGRQLLRLSEALMGDLGELRISGLWMPTVVCLVRHGALVLAVDGFDELAAEQGGADALGALALLVQEMEDHGVLIAASRRTFFDTDDYLARSRLLNRSISQECEFHQLRLCDWGRKETTEYFSVAEEDGHTFEQPALVYDELLSALGGDVGHPIISRPFLVTHIARALLRYQTKPADLVGKPDEPFEGVASVVKAFVKREVEEKWKVRETGEPYLTAEQHLILLSTVAEEMWLAGTDRLRLDAVEEISRVLLDAWSIQADRQRQVLDMVRMHVLLTVPPGISGEYRSFDHPEFRHYFTAAALEDRLAALAAGKQVDSTRRFLSTAQLSDSAARYAASLLIERAADRSAILMQLLEIARSERRPTYVQPNAGTLVAALLDGLSNASPLQLEGPIIFTSLVLEETELRDLVLDGATFLNPSFRSVRWQNVKFKNCDISEAVFDSESAEYRLVSFDSCRLNGIRIVGASEERHYAPARISEALKQLGITIVNSAGTILDGRSHDVERRRILQRLLKAFRRSTSISEGDVEKRLRSDKERIFNELIPLMLRHGVLEEVEPYRGRHPIQKRWALTVGHKELLSEDVLDGTSALAEFWQALDEA